MFMKRFLLFLSILFLISSNLHAEDPGSRFRQLSFLEGCWKGDWSGSNVYETWGNQDGSIMLGVSKTVSNGQVESFEFLHLGINGNDIRYTPYVNGSKSVFFLLTSLTPASAAFSNPDHDFPQLIKYERRGDQLHIMLSGEGKPQGYTLKSVSCRE